MPNNDRGPGRTGGLVWCSDFERKTWLGFELRQWWLWEERKEGRDLC